MDKLVYILILILFLLVLNLYMGKKTEYMANLDDGQKAEVKKIIYDTYKVDVNAIKNLSEIASKLQKEGLTIPGNLTVTGDIRANNITSANEINIKDTNTKLSKGDGNALRIKTAGGWVDVGAQNDGWCHIYSDRPKFAFNKQITDVAGPYLDYIKTSDKNELANNTNVLRNDFNALRSKFDGYEFKPVCMRNSTSGWKSWIDYDNTCNNIGLNNIRNWGWDAGGFTAVLPVKGKY